MEIRWKASFSASCLHAVCCLHEGWPAVDPELGKTIAEPAELLITTIGDNHWPVEELLSELAVLSSDYENNRQLAELALQRVHGSSPESMVSPLAAAISGLESRVLASGRDLVEELVLRGKPLQQQWQARGPGLLRQVQRLTAENFLAAAAEVTLVTPWVGGYGYGHLKSNRVLFEAVLANPYDELPETLRLGWLLAQLNADLPVFSDVIPPDRLALLARLATLPVVLSAAEAVEWGTCNPATIARALSCWHIAPPPTMKLAEQIWRWWHAYQEGTASWYVAWRGLESLLR